MPVWLFVLIVIGIVAASPIWLPLLVQVLLWVWMVVLVVVLGVTAVISYPFIWLWDRIQDL